MVHVASKSTVYNIVEWIFRAKFMEFQKCSMVISAVVSSFGSPTSLSIDIPANQQLTSMFHGKFWIAHKLGTTAAFAHHHHVKFDIVIRILANGCSSTFKQNKQQHTKAMAFKVLGKVLVARVW